MLDDTIQSHAAICNLHEKIHELEEELDDVVDDDDEDKGDILDKYGFNDVDVKDFNECMKKYHKKLRRIADKVIEIVVDMCENESCIESDDE